MVSLIEGQRKSGRLPHSRDRHSGEHGPSAPLSVRWPRTILPRARANSHSSPEKLAANIQGCRGLSFLSGHTPTTMTEPTLRWPSRQRIELGRGLQSGSSYGSAVAPQHSGPPTQFELVVGIIKALGFVNSALGFFDQPQVTHSFSNLMDDVFDERDRQARAPIGTSSLPRNQPVEIELIVAVSSAPSSK